MAVYFLDSSAVVKRYVAESGSAWVTALMRPSDANQLHVARISSVEVVAAIGRRVRVGSMTAPSARDAAARFRADFATLHDVVEISAGLIARAMDLAEKHTLRGYDAVQLAAALAVRDGAAVIGSVVTIVSADDELNVAAVAEGLMVENPNRHS